MMKYAIEEKNMSTTWLELYIKDCHNRTGISKKTN
jgi:hypothetical protein